MGVKNWIKRKIIVPLVLKELVKFINNDVRKKAIQMLKGKKAYIVAIVGAIIAIGNIVLKLVNGQTISMEDIYAVLGAAGLGALRAGVSKVEK